MLGHAPSLQHVSWPQPDEEALQADENEVVFQVSGTLRGKEMLPAGTDGATLEQRALAHPGFQDPMPRCVRGRNTDDRQRC